MGRYFSRHRSRVALASIAVVALGILAAQVWMTAAQRPDHDGPLSSFLAYPPEFEGGIQVAAADVDGDGHPDVITGAVVSAGARVKVFSGVDGSVIASFLVQGAAFENGIKVAAADVTGDGKAEVVVGAGSSGGGACDLRSGGDGHAGLGNFGHW